MNRYFLTEATKQYYKYSLVDGNLKFAYFTPFVTLVMGGVWAAILSHIRFFHILSLNFIVGKQ